MPRLFRSFVAGLTAAAVAVSSVAPAFAREAMTPAEYEACQSRDENALRTALEQVIVGSLRSGTQGIDFRASVQNEWRRTGMDEILDKRVDIAIAEVRDETSWGSLLQSLANEEKAKALATAVAERV